MDDVFEVPAHYEVGAASLREAGPATPACRGRACPAPTEIVRFLRSVHDFYLGRGQIRQNPTLSARNSSSKHPPNTEVSA